MTTLARTLRAAGRDSVAVDGVARLTAAIRAALTNAAREPQVAPLGGDEQALSAQIVGSRTARAVHAFADALERAWSESRIRTAIEPFADGLRTLTGVQRIRAAGLWMTIAAVTDGVLSLVDPRPASAIRWALWAACIVSGAVAALAAAPLQAAWTEWQRTR